LWNNKKCFEALCSLIALVKYRPLAQAVLFYNEHLEMYSAVLPSVHQLIWLEHSHRVCELHWLLVVTIFNMAVSTCEWFWHSGMRPLGQQVGFSVHPANVQISLISLKQSLTLSKADWFWTSWNGSLLHLFDAFCASQRCLCFIRNTFSFFWCSLRLLYVLFRVCFRFLEAYVENGFWYLWWFCESYLMMNIKTAL
jgi:hypothetical protein